MAGICGMFPGMGVAKKIEKKQEWKMLGGKSRNGMKKEEQKGKHSGLAAEIIFYFLVFMEPVFVYNKEAAEIRNLFAQKAKKWELKHGYTKKTVESNQPVCRRRRMFLRFQTWRR